MNSTYIMSRKQESNVFGLRTPNECNTLQLCRIGESKILMNSTYIMSRKQEIKRFCAQEAKMSLTANSSIKIGQKNIFHELDVHHVQKVGIKRFWAREAKMSLTANSSVESARVKFLMNSTYIMSRKLESNVFGLWRRIESNCHKLSPIGEKKIFHELYVHHVQRVGIKRFVLRRPQ